MKQLLVLLLLGLGVAEARPVVTPIDEVIPKVLQDSIRKGRGRVRAEPLGPDRERHLEDRDSPVKNQFGGTCTTHGLLATIENLVGDHKSYSARYFWNHYHQYSAPVAIRTGMSVAQIYETQWPPSVARSPKNLTPKDIVKLSDAPYLGSSITNILNSIDHGFPVYIASTVLQDMYACKGTVAPTSMVVAGAGHAYAIVGYKVDSKVEGGGWLLIKNSWGADCGLKGYQWMPFTICTRTDTYCAAWSIRAVQKLQ